MAAAMSSLRRITFDSGPWPLHGTDASRRIEALAAAACPPHTLMQRAGEAVARLAIALAPHGQRVWIAAGPGNNGGDGFEAACRLQQAGRQVQLTALGNPARRSADASASLARAQAAGVRIENSLPGNVQCDLAIDAIFGLGATRAAAGSFADALRLFNGLPGPRLAIDLPSGLDSDLGFVNGEISAQATHTLLLLTLKPGLFTGCGREQAGEPWFDDLGTGDAAAQVPPQAWLGGADAALDVPAPRRHARHKGSFGDVIVVGGAPGMLGAALLAGRAALAAGAGRVYVSALDADAPRVDMLWPELMLRRDLWRAGGAVLGATTVVCGCGGGDLVRDALPLLMTRAARLVLDADALNAIAADNALQSLLAARAGRGQATILTPHPLEAARLAGVAGAAQVQSDRLGHAQRLAERMGCVVLLKGSGTVIAAPGQASRISASGNARLASAGTGDVLAGWLGGLWAAAQEQAPPPSPQRVAQAAAWSHGAVAESGNARTPLTASSLLQRLAAAG
jgi:hydroxyethylthiazole kinase-like uncharacterized protein yjeF